MGYVDTTGGFLENIYWHYPTNTEVNREGAYIWMVADISLYICEHWHFSILLRTFPMIKDIKVYFYITVLNHENIQSAGQIDTI